MATLPLTLEGIECCWGRVDAQLVQDGWPIYSIASVVMNWIDKWNIKGRLSQRRSKGCYLRAVFWGYHAANGLSFGWTRGLRDLRCTTRVFTNWGKGTAFHSGCECLFYGKTYGHIKIHNLLLTARKNRIPLNVWELSSVIVPRGRLHTSPLFPRNTHIISISNIVSGSSSRVHLWQVGACSIIARVPL